MIGYGSDWPAAEDRGEEGDALAYMRDLGRITRVTFDKAREEVGHFCFRQILNDWLKELPLHNPSHTFGEAGKCKTTESI